MGRALLSVWVTVVFLMACAPRDVPRQASAPLTAPTIVARPDRELCDEELLERAQPWAGRILSREPLEVEHDQRSFLVHTDWVYCNGLEQEACREWAQRAGEERAKGRDLSVHIWDGRSVRGTLWVLTRGEREEGHLLQSNRDLVSLFRALVDRGEHPAIVDSRRVVEARPGRVEIEYRQTKRDAELAAARWVFETSSDPQALVEATLAFEDLEARGIELHYTSWDQLYRAAREATRDADPYPALRAAPRAANAEPKKFWLEVRCTSP